MAVPESHPRLTMHGYFRSSCTGRLRIAMFFKDIDYEYVPVNLAVGSHNNEEFAKISPQRTVPAVFIEGRKAPITQSLAALEYFEEEYPETAALLPKTVFERAQVRSLVDLVVADIQPIANPKITKRIGEFGYEAAQWSREYHSYGFAAFEIIIQGTAGVYCFGDEITMADVCLAPAMWNAERWGVDMTPFPTIKKVYENASTHPAFQKGHWKQQPDCPDSLKL